MSRKINKNFRNYILQNLERFKDLNGHIMWKRLVEDVRQAFPYERVTYDRVREIGRGPRNIGKKQTSSPQLDVNVEPGKIIQSSMNGEQKELTITIDPTKVNSAKLTTKDMMALFDLDENEWECQRFDIKTWNTTIKDSNGKPNQVTNYGVHAVFKPIKGKLKEEDLSWIFNKAREASLKESAYEIPKYYYDHNALAKENTLVLAIFD